jgi:hypothetical protein
MKRTPVNSSMIASVGYDRQERILEVEFVNTGHVYEYYDVPYREYLNLMKDESKGSYMKTFIIDQYGYSRVSRSRHKKNNHREPADPPGLEHFAGTYTLYELLDLDGDPVETEGEATFQIDSAGRGTFQLGKVRGRLHGKVAYHYGDSTYQFKWQGKDENATASGDGWLVLHGDGEAEGEISFFDGDDCSFRARKEGGNI